MILYHSLACQFAVILQKHEEEREKNTIHKNLMAACLTRMYGDKYSHDRVTSLMGFPFIA